MGITEAMTMQYLGQFVVCIGSGLGREDSPGPDVRAHLEGGGPPWWSAGCTGEGG